MSGVGAFACCVPVITGVIHPGAGTLCLQWCGACKEGHSLGVEGKREGGV